MAVQLTDGERVELNGLLDQVKERLVEIRERLPEGESEPREARLPTADELKAASNAINPTLSEEIAFRLRNLMEAVYDDRVPNELTMAQALTLQEFAGDLELSAEVAKDQAESIRHSLAQLRGWQRDDEPEMYANMVAEA